MSILDSRRALSWRWQQPAHRRRIRRWAGHAAARQGNRAPESLHAAAALQCEGLISQIRHPLRIADKSLGLSTVYKRDSVMCLVLGREQATKIVGHRSTVRIDSTQHLYGLHVVLTPRPLLQSGATRGVRRSNTCQNRQSRSNPRRRGVCVIAEHKLGSHDKRITLPPTTRRGFPR